MARLGSISESFNLGSDLDGNYCPLSAKIQRIPPGEGRIWGAPPPSTHNALFQRNELLFLLLALLKMHINERLQLQEVLLLPLPVDVLQDRR